MLSKQPLACNLHKSLHYTRATENPDRVVPDVIKNTHSVPDIWPGQARVWRNQLVITIPGESVKRS